MIGQFTHVFCVTKLQWFQTTEQAVWKSEKSLKMFVICCNYSYNGHVHSWRQFQWCFEIVKTNCIKVRFGGVVADNIKHNKARIVCIIHGTYYRNVTMIPEIEPEMWWHWPRIFNACVCYIWIKYIILWLPYRECPWTITYMVRL